MGKEINDMQVACAWIGDTLISVSLSGQINYLDSENPSKPKKVIKVKCLYLKPVNCFM